MALTNSFEESAVCDFVVVDIDAPVVAATEICTAIRGTMDSCDDCYFSLSNLSSPLPYP